MLGVSTRVKRIRCAAICGTVIAVACAPSIIRHNQHVAAKEAERFAKLALVDRNYSEAVKFVVGDESAENLASVVAEHHRLGKFPVNVLAVSYQPVPGTESINIYLEGSGSDPSYHYLAVMVGTESKGYKVSAIGRSIAPFPSGENIMPLR